MKKPSLLFIAFCCFINLYGQIIIDGRINEWQNSATYIDDPSDGNNIELLEIAADNNDSFLFLRIKSDDEINLTEDSGLILYLDTDNDPQTGYSFGNLGAELVWEFEDNNGVFYYNNQSESIWFDDLFYRALPTHSDTHFEFAIDRNTMISGNNLFPNGSINIKIQDPGGDMIPNSSQSFIYTFNDNNDTIVPIDWQKNDDSNIRIMSWNTKLDGLLDPVRSDAFKKIIDRSKPNIIAFQEVWDMTESQASNFMNDIFPYQSWFISKNESNNIIASQFPILEEHSILSGKRLQAAVIDLPDSYNTDLLLINVHLKCCGGQSNDEQRQFEADAIAKFILDLKLNTGPFLLEPQTPVFVVGDMNMVGSGDQRITILDGIIQNTATFGYGGPLDWDDSALSDLTPIQSSNPFAITWRNDFSSFSPGRLDYVFYTDAVVDISKSFIIQTEEMTDDQLSNYILDGNETNLASDHFPIIFDLSLETITDISENSEQVNKLIFTETQNDITFTGLRSGIIRLYSQDGKIIAEDLISDGSLTFNKVRLRNNKIFIATINNQEIGKYFVY